MIRRRTPELALLKRFEIPGHPLRAAAYTELEPAMIKLITSELAGRKGVSKKYLAQWREHIEVFK
jgi:hypothetical protein